MIGNRDLGLFRQKVDAVDLTGNDFYPIKIREVSDVEIEKAQEAGINIEGYRHQITSDFIRHALSRHSDILFEKRRKNRAITKEDIKTIPQIIDSPDYYIFGEKRDGKEAIIYAKIQSNVTSLYFEEILGGKKNRSLRGTTLYKRDESISPDKLLRILGSNRRNDITGAKVVLGGGGQSTGEAGLNTGPTAAASAIPADTLNISQSPEMSSPESKYSSFVRLRGLLTLKFLACRPAWRKCFAAMLLLCALAPAGAPPAAAQEAPAIGSQAAVLLDAETGAVLYEKNPGQEIPPASLTKLMTMHIVFEEIAAGRASPEETMEPPRASWAVNQPPRSSLMYLAAGQTVSLRDILLGLAIPSGNDAAVAAALRFAPSVEAFAARMNSEARGLGLAKTHFVEPSGISEYNITTAGEFARFCRFYVRMHPEALTEYHSVRTFSFPLARNVAPPFRANPRTVVFTNHNRLLATVPGTDGLKTGYIDEAGYNIALTAEREGTRFVAVILGAPAEWGGRPHPGPGRRAAPGVGLQLFQNPPPGV